MEIKKIRAYRNMQYKKTLTFCKMTGQKTGLK